MNNNIYINIDMNTSITVAVVGIGLDFATIGAVEARITDIILGTLTPMSISLSSHVFSLREKLILV